jgi:hypothetical protein
MMHAKTSTMMMKRYLILCSIILAALTQATAQTPVFPVRVQAFPLVNATVYISDFADPAVNASRLQFDLTLLDPVEQSREVYFRISILENGRLALRSNPGFIGPIITLTKDIPERITGLDLAPYLDRNNLVGVSSTGQVNVLNEGFNSICLEVMDLYRGEPISRRICAEGFWRRLDPPLLALPLNNALFTQSELVSQFFNWQVTDPLVALLGLQARIRYEYELRELPVGMNPQDAFDNYILVYSAAPFSPLVFYNEITPGLEVGKAYAWRVRAIIEDEFGQPLPGYFNNNGYSMVSVFTVEEDAPVFIPAGYACDCTGPECEPAEISNTRQNNRLAVNDELEVGLFKLTINELSSTSGGRASGQGAIQIPFLNLEVNTRFTNLRANTDNQVFDGRLEVERDAIIADISAKANGALDFPYIGSFTAPYVEQLIQTATQPANLIPRLPLSLRSKLQGLGLSLPTSGDFIVTNLYFTPQGAALDAMIILPDGAGGYVRFGASGIGLRPNGLDLSNLVFFLGDDLALPGLGSVPLLIKKAEVAEANTGSFLAFDCNGFREFNLQAEYTFPTAQFVQADSPGAAVVALLTLNSTQWGQFLASAELPAFSIVGLDDWRFEALQASADFALNQNPADIAFPAGYGDDPGPAWRGFHIRQLNLRLPDELRLGSAEPITFSAEHLIIDANGASALLRGSNLLSLATGQVGGWGFSIDSLEANIAMNNLIDTRLQGGMEVGILDAQLSYTGLLTQEADGYAFDLSPAGNFRVEFLKLDVGLQPGSALSIRRPAAGQAYRPYADLNLEINMNIGEQEFVDAGLGELLNGFKNVLGLSQFDFGLSGLQFEGLKINHPDLPAGRHVGLDDMSGGSILIPGLGGISLDELQLLDQTTDFDGIDLPGIGLDFSLGFGPISFGLGVWGKQVSSTMNGGSPRFEFGKFELRAPSIPRLSFRCRCDAPTAQGDTPPLDFCTAPTLTGGTPAPLAEGERVKLGHFTLLIESLSSSNSGTGKIEMPFLNKLLEVQFSSLVAAAMPNGEKRATSGWAVSQTTSLLPDDLADQATAMVESAAPFDLSSLPVTDALMSSINNVAASIGAFFSLPFSIRHKMQEFLGTELPDDFDLVLLGMRFEPQKARTSSMLTVKVGQDRYLKFGIAGLEVRPDGMNLDGIQIYLAEDFSFGF